MRRRTGFTLIELLVVLAAVALLLGLTAPRYVEHIDRAREAALRSNLAAMRDAIDRFHADRGVYPAALQELVDGHYLRSIPADPFTERTDGWRTTPPPGESTGRVGDVFSTAPGAGRDGKPYASW